MRTIDGTALGSLRSDGLGRDHSIPAGSGFAEVTLPQLPLTAGTYVLDATVTSGSDKRVVDHLRNAGEIVVHADGPDGPAGPVAFGGTWLDSRVR